MEKIDTNNDQGNTDTKNDGSVPKFTLPEGAIPNDPKNHPSDEGNKNADDY